MSENLHPVRRVSVGGPSADIDEELAPIVEVIWRLGLTTAPVGRLSELRPHGDTASADRLRGRPTYAARADRSVKHGCQALGMMRHFMHPASWLVHG
ncbi:hypothetical protein U2F26_35310 [Micromonospora sp. 4G57]|uniref:Uncharacterized protein n=1 Tax=Micromonospora sicca TaxID=2202420 RepID=A0ABU5JQ32_9ACTN|nr:MULTISPECIES: hypothetical protein [unclassified Micromonospora]MDZ5447904.1 hypothetical protein [Micromonospora sp. 4G57]MDZ5494656.1 hypothetical protein [Micromonospora sp. 4G53]